MSLVSPDKLGLSKDPFKDKKDQDQGGLTCTSPSSTPQADDHLIQKCVRLHRSEKGYGLTVSGESPVFIQSIKANGAAAKAGVVRGDRIIKVNGVLVTNCNHIEVVKRMTSGPFVVLSLLGQPSASEPADLPSPLSADTTASLNITSSPNIERKINQMISEDDQLNRHPDARHQTMSQVEDQLSSFKHTNFMNDLQTGSPSSEFPAKRPSSASSSDRHSSSTASYSLHGPGPGVKHRKSDSMPDTLYKIDEMQRDMCVVRSESQGNKSQMMMEEEEEAKKGNLEDDETMATTSVGKKVDDNDIAPNPTVLLSGAEACVVESPSSIHPTDPPGKDPTISQPSVPESSSVGGFLHHFPSFSLSAPAQVNVMSMEDEDISSNCVEDPNIFSDLEQLKHYPAHLAVFLHYLMSNSDSSPLLFYLVTESYASSNIKELRKWAYEIYSTFLCDKAPLKINVDETIVSSVENILQTKFDKDEAMKNVFHASRNVAKNEIQDLLADFRSKRALGLGSIYGDHDLKDVMDKSTEWKIIENTLWKHFERLVTNEESDRNVALSSALATFFKQVGFSSSKNSSFMERCSSFNAKDKKVFKFPKSNKKIHNGHQFALQHYYTTTFCCQCHAIIWGIGYQGYQCTICEINVHKNCLEHLKDRCSAGLVKKKKEKRPQSMFDKIISRKPSTNSPSAIKEAQRLHEEIANLPSPTAAVHMLSPGLPEEDDELENLRGNVEKLVDRYTESTKNLEDSKSISTNNDSPEFLATEDSSSSTVNLGRSESLNQKSETRTSIRRAHSDVASDNQAAGQLANSSGSSSNSSLSAKSYESANNSGDGACDSSIQPSLISQKSQLNDKDFDTEVELPPLEASIPKDVLRKLKPKEKKRQEVINELFYTERAHVRNLKVMHRLFYLPMREESWISSEFVMQIFPNIEEMIELHCSLNNAFKEKKSENPVVGDFAAILEKRFYGSDGEKFKLAAAKFCQHQSLALETLRIKQRKDQKLANFLQEAASHPLCRRLELKDLIPTAMQRLTKYPLLIENLLKYTVSNTTEYEVLVKAHEQSKRILNYVNQRVEECENHQRLVEFQKRLDKRPIENSSHPVVAEYKKLDLTRHKMIYDGSLTWRICRSKQIDLHVVLLEDILVLLQKGQDDKLVLRCQSTNVATSREDQKQTHSPIIKLTNLLTRSVATDKRAFFLVSISDFGPQIYELVANSKEEKNRWFKYISEAADVNKNKEDKAGKVVIRDEHLSETPEITSTTIADNRMKIDAMVHENEFTAGKHSSTESLEDASKVEIQRFEPPRLVQPNEVKVSHMEIMEKMEPVSTNLEIKEKNKLIDATMVEKKRLIAELLNIPIEEYDHIAEVVDEVSGSKDVRELLLSSLTQADKLTRLVDEKLSLNETRLHVTESGDRDSDSQEKAGTVAQPLLPMNENLNRPTEQFHRTSLDHSDSKEMILVSGGQLASISIHLQNSLVQLLDVIVQREHERERMLVELERLNELQASTTAFRTDETNSNGRPNSFISVNSSTSEVVEEIECLAQEPECVDVSSSVVTIPIVTECLEIIEAETLVGGSSCRAPSEETLQLTCIAPENICTTSADEQVTSGEVRDRDS